MADGILSKVKDAIRGFSTDDIAKKVNKLSKKELESIVGHASAYSARRTLSPKNYSLWKAAYDRLGELEESTTVNEKVEDKKVLKDLIKGYEKEIDDLLKQYGRGVRPSWVSGEIGSIEARIQDLQKRVK